MVNGFKYCYLTRIIIFNWGGYPCGVMVKVMGCAIIVSEFVLQLRYYVHF